MTKRVVITDATFPDVAKEEAAAKAAGASFERHACKTADEVTAAIKGADVAVVQFAPLTRAAIAGLAPGATAIRYGVGYNNFDVAALNDHSVKAAYVPDYCTAEVADHTAASLLALLRKLPALDASVRKGDWAAVGTAKPLKSFRETTIGFLGFGRIAQEVATRLAPFGFHFLAHDPYFTGSFPRLTLTDLPGLLAGSDALTLHAPATAETTGIINAANLRRMKSTAVLVNTARGDLIDEPALAAALTTGTIAAAALDVFLAEPLPADNPLRTAPNLLLGPHAAWYSDVAVERLQSLVADEITRALTGQGVRKPIPGSTA
jgi:D-3-phosphoglycerate dehydrogenase / 2-oxoglutarate reductase